MKHRVIHVFKDTAGEWRQFQAANIAHVKATIAANRAAFEAL